MNAGSLRLRLAAGGAAAIVCALIIAGFGLAYLFERHAMRSMQDALEVDLRQLLDGLEFAPDGKPFLRHQPSDPRFAEPLSGLYWQLTTGDGTAMRSRSLWDEALKLPEDALSSADLHRHRITGPNGADLLAVERNVVLKDTGKDVRAVAAADVARIAEARRAFTRELIPSLALLGAVLAAATWVQIGLGLRPLRRLQEAVAAIRRGKAERVGGPAPREVAPLVEEIDSLLASLSAEVERSRARAGDLAHGLKTPLAALAADVRRLEDKGEHEIAAGIAEIGETMRRHVERELSRARIRASRNGTAAKATPVTPLIKTLVTIQQRTEEGARLDFEAACEGAATTMDKADLAEVLGNLLENAARHAASKVRVCVPRPGWLAVDDDGPGIPEDERETVLKRGGSLDAGGRGAGLGLTIITEVLAANGRQLELTQSPLGGLRASFALDPAAS